MSLDLQNEIKKVLEEEISPSLKAHGGDAEFKELKDGVVYILFHGACKGCPGAQSTIENIVEARLKARFPQIKRVELASEITQDMIDFAKKILSKKK